MKTSWLVQFSVPWQSSGLSPEAQAREKTKQKKVARYTRYCAEAIARTLLFELGEGARVRVYNPKSGEYVAMLQTEGDENEKVKVYHGREDRSARP